jgi:hypothetical protein
MKEWEKRKIEHGIGNKNDEEIMKAIVFEEG